MSVFVSSGTASSSSALPYTLQSLSISLVEPLGWSVDNLRCDDDLEWFSGRQQQEAQRLGRRTRDELIDSASGALEKLPSLQKLVITEVEDPRDGSERLLLARDIKAGKTAAMPTVP